MIIKASPPSFYMARPNKDIERMMEDEGFVKIPQGLENVEDADIIVFGGGADINPILYGQPLIKGTYIDIVADRMDIAVLRASRRNQPKIGICRGAQFLNVMVGNGSLFQHVGDHNMLGGHRIYELDKDGKPIDKNGIWASSTHHQMMIPGENGVILWATNVALLKKHAHVTYRLTETQASSNYSDPEVVYYVNHDTLCFQPHPEMSGEANKECRKLFFELVDTYLLTSQQYAGRNHVKGAL